MNTTLETFAVTSTELPSRVRLEYVEHGDPSGIPMVLLHGLSDSWHSYERVLPHLPASIHAFALSQRGHGDSERPESGYSPRDFAADVAALLDDRGVERAVIVGHSMGGAVAQRFAIDMPERTLGIVLVDTFATFSDNPTIEEFQGALSALSDPIDPSFVREFQASTLTKPVPLAFFDKIVGESLKVPARVWQAVIAGLLDHESFLELGQINAPTLIIWGDQDAYVPRRDAEALQAAIAGSQLLIYPDTGHDVQWEEPGRFAADLAAFVERLAR